MTSRRSAILLPLIGIALCACGNDPRIGSPSRHFGICDASGATALGNNRFLVVDDEDNTLRIYDATESGNARRSFSALWVLGVDDDGVELDLEAAAALGDRIFWISSHGRDREGRLAPERQTLFATTGAGDGPIERIGEVYTGLARDLESDERLAALGLDAAIRSDVARDRNLMPKAGGLNIEGLAAAPDGEGLYLALRNPLADDRAIVVPLENPNELISGGGPARLGVPRLLDLGRRGISAIERAPRHGGYLLVAAPRVGPGEFAVYRWSGAADAAPIRLLGLNRPGFRPEALVVFDDSDRVLLVSDDGNTEVRGIRCKRLRDASAKSFRSLPIDLPAVE